MTLSRRARSCLAASTWAWACSMAARRSAGRDSIVSGVRASASAVMSATASAAAASASTASAAAAAVWMMRTGPFFRVRLARAGRAELLLVIFLGIGAGEKKLSPRCPYFIASGTVGTGSAPRIGGIGSVSQLSPTVPAQACGMVGRESEFSLFSRAALNYIFSKICAGL